MPNHTTQGKAQALSEAPWVSSTIQAVPCPNGCEAGGIVPGTDGTNQMSGCTTDAAHTGFVTATTHPPYFISTLCPKGDICCPPGQVADAAGACQDW